MHPEVEQYQSGLTKLASDAEIYRLRFQGPEVFGDGAVASASGVELELYRTMSTSSDPIEGMFGTGSEMIEQQNQRTMDTIESMTVYKAGKVNKKILG